MTALLGSTALAAGMVAALLATGAWTATARGRAPALARRATWLMLAGALVACGALEVALLTHDFSVRYVAENGGRDVPLLFTVTGLWSALEGSLLLWLLVLCGYAVLLARRVPEQARHLHPVAMAVVSAVAAAFFALALLAGNAFSRVWPVPADGPGPNPLLQDHPAMGIHPPLLYVGFLGLLVPFAYATAALVTGDTGPAWLAASRRWTLVAWSALTAGIVLGSWWAYAVLGWGGYWAWDPVENASLLPWLTATALLHSALISTRRPALRLWSLSLAGATFVLVLVGTFLTRSGVLASVHSFTQSPLGPALLAIAVGVLAGFTGLLVWRADRLGAQVPVGPPVSRGAAVVANNLLLVSLAFTVLLGTVYPLLAEAVSGARLSVGAPYFNRSAPPFALALVLLMAVGPLAATDGERPSALLRRMALPGAVALAVVAVLGLGGARGPTAILACGLGAFVVASVVVQVTGHLRTAQRDRTAGRLRTAAGVLHRRRRLYGGLLAHVGIALAAVAVAASSSWSVTAEGTLRVGDTVAAGDASARLVSLDRQGSSAGMSTRAVLETSRGRLAPELRFFPKRAVLVSSPAIASSARGDLYLTLVEAAEDGRSARVRLTVSPLVPWLWVAGAVIALGGLVAAWPSRRRTGRTPTPLVAATSPAAVSAAVPAAGSPQDRPDLVAAP